MNVALYVSDPKTLDAAIQPNTSIEIEGTSTMTVPMKISFPMYANSRIFTETDVVSVPRGLQGSSFQRHPLVREMFLCAVAWYITFLYTLTV